MATPSDSQNNRKAPAIFLTTRVSEVDQDGHPGKVKAKRAARELKKGRGWNHFNINRR